MNKKTEVEIRALLEEKDGSKIKNKLQDLGANSASKVEIKDYYFCLEEVEDFSEIEMDEVGSYSLRVREQGDKAELNTKVIKEYGDHNAWIEHETKVSSPEEMRKILKSIGFKNFITIKKEREIFEWRDFQICFDDIEQFGFGIEVEVMTDEEGKNEAKRKIHQLFKKLGVKKEDIVPKSITNLVMREGAEF